MIKTTLRMTNDQPYRELALPHQRKRKKSIESQLSLRITCSKETQSSKFIIKQLWPPKSFKDSKIASSIVAGNLPRKLMVISTSLQAYSPKTTSEISSIEPPVTSRIQRQDWARSFLKDFLTSSWRNSNRSRQKRRFLRTTQRFSVCQTLLNLSR